MKITSELIGDKKARKFLKKLGPFGVEALVRATNNTGSTAKTLADREIRAQIDLKKTEVSENLHFLQARRKRIEYVFWATKRGRLLSRFPHRVLKKGVKVKVKKKGPQKLIKGAFKTTVKAGGRRVDVIAAPGERLADGRRKRYATGNPTIKVFYGPSISQVLDKTRDMITDRVARRFEEQLDKELQNAIKRLLRS